MKIIILLIAFQSISLAENAKSQERLKKLENLLGGLIVASLKKFKNKMNRKLNTTLVSKLRVRPQTSLSAEREYPIRSIPKHQNLT